MKKNRIKKVKSTLCTLLSFAMVAAYMPSDVAFKSGILNQVYADSTYEYVDGNNIYTYFVDDSGCVEILQYTGSDGNIEIPSYIDDKNVTVICENAFKNCNTIENVTLPYTMKKLGNSAFYGCKNLKSIKFSRSWFGYTEDIVIDERAFYGCSAIEELTIPSNVEEIGLSAFEFCENLKNLEISEGLTKIGNWAFDNCNSLESVTIPESVNSIGTAAFGQCKSLKEIIILNPNTTFGSFDFFNVSSEFALYAHKGSVAEQFASDNKFDFKILYRDDDKNLYAYIVKSDGTVEIAKSIIQECELNIPSEIDGKQVTSIGENAFKDDENMESLTIPSSVTSIKSQAFNNCIYLGDVVISNKNISISNDAFKDCDKNYLMLYGEIGSGIESYAKANDIKFGGLYIKGNDIYKCNINNDGTIGIKKYIGSSTEITIPATINGKNVVSIDNSAFKYCRNIKKITIPNGVTSIGAYAFDNCSALTSISMPNTLKTIGASAFIYCNSLTSVVVPNSVTSIGNHAFSFCDNLEEVTLSTNLTKIEANMFACSGLKKLTIPNSVTSIDSGMCNRCLELTEVTLSNKIKEIPRDAFCDCKKLNNVVIPDGVTTIGPCAFEYCSGLNNISIPESVTSIGEYAFAYNTGLKTIQLPSKITAIEEATFYDCENLENITIPNGVILIGRQAFMQCYKLGSTTIPCSVQTIGSEAFYACKSIKNVSIPSSVTSLKYNAFGQCKSLESVILPSSLTCIEDITFIGCESLTSIRIPSSITSISENAFYDRNNLTIYTPKSSYAETYAKQKYINYVNISECTHENTKKTVKKASLTDDGQVVTMCSDCCEITSNTAITKINKITLSATSYKYDGTVKKPTVTVVDAEGKTIASSNYTVSYENGSGTAVNPVEKGTYKVKVVFKENYSGTKYISFTIGDEAGKWIKSNGKWWYRHADGTYTKNGWEKIDGKWYHFDASGYMQTGWQKISNKWYYFGASGVMLTGWQKVGTKWYYFEGSGAMLTGWQKLSNKWYYFNTSGVMLTGWQEINSKWYYFGASGVMQSACWVNKIYYMDSTGAMVTSAYIKDGSKYYWVDKNGKYTKTYSEKDTKGYTIYDQTTGKKIS